jgi:hypothetical protein
MYNHGIMQCMCDQEVFNSICVEMLEPELQEDVSHFDPEVDSDS